ncbi:MAG TPA: hypothetical protein VF246_02200 [Acidimicrobiia bacterium]
MAFNPDPKPGRWILPLVVLAMIAFTYYFVRELPAASPTSTTIGAGSTTTTGAGEGSTSTTAAGPTDPAVQDYVDAVRAINDALAEQGSELTAANTGFDANPRTVEYRDAVSRFEAVQGATEDLLTQLQDLTAPESVAAHHENLVEHLTAAVQAAEDALNGLQSDDPGTIRRSAVDAYANTVTQFADELAALEETAGVPPAGE